MEDTRAVSMFEYLGESEQTAKSTGDMRCWEKVQREGGLVSVVSWLL